MLCLGTELMSCCMYVEMFICCPSRHRHRDRDRHRESEATRRRGGEASEASKASEARQARKARHAASLKARDASLMACAGTRFWCLPEGGRSASTRASAPVWPTDPVRMHRRARPRLHYRLLTLCPAPGAKFSRGSKCGRAAPATRHARAEVDVSGGAIRGLWMRRAMFPSEPPPVPPPS